MKKATVPKVLPTVIVNGMGPAKPIDSFKATRKNPQVRVVNITDDEHNHEISFLKNGKHLIIVVDNQVIWTEPTEFRIL